MSSLKAYVKKRDFKKTAEPRGKVEKAAKGKALRFVIQKHDATRLHYDFRLELDGTLKSWAVPKGVPYEHGERRLAVHVEDHPISYIAFEGTIPKGQYGGGTVMVWDQGTYEPLTEHPSKDLEGGKLHFVLKGKKLSGEWYLVRIRDPQDNQWLLIRGGENHKPVSAKQDDTSIVSGKSMKQLSKSENVWESEPAEGAAPDSPAAKAKVKKAAKAKAGAKAAPRGSTVRAAFTAGPSEKSTAKLKKPTPKKKGPPLKFVEPMKARLLAEPPAGDWVYEIKFDGFRALALKDGDTTQLLSRNEKTLADKFPEVAPAVAALDVDDAILDGEIVALDDKGRSSFQLLQAYELGDASPPLQYYVFDLLRLNGEGLIDLPLEERKARLEKLLTSKGNAKAGEILRYSASLKGEPAALLDSAREVGLEGLIGKRVGSLYEIGSRSGSWIKLKLHQEQEFVIGGYTPPSGSRQYFGALIIGVYEGKKLIFTGKVGTGFNHKLLKSIYAELKKLSIQECPFSNLPEERDSRYGQGITKSYMKQCHWVKPQLVCQIKFSEWTRDGSLRQPVFLGLREDKPANKVVREKAA